MPPLVTHLHFGRALETVLRPLAKGTGYKPGNPWRDGARRGGGLHVGGRAEASDLQWKIDQLNAGSPHAQHSEKLFRKILAVFPLTACQTSSRSCFPSASHRCFESEG